MVTVTHPSSTNQSPKELERTELPIFRTLTALIPPLLSKFANTLRTYFQNIFSNHITPTSNVSIYALNQHDAGQQVMSLQNYQHISSIPDKHELHSIIKNMRSNALPWAGWTQCGVL